MRLRCTLTYASTMPMTIESSS
uniref:Uncharacterized protein n=1 Tax=Anguilla anguilla TaxID=7936 RepID=A0A0E9T728_ANGAN